MSNIFQDISPIMHCDDEGRARFNSELLEHRNGRNLKALRTLMRTDNPGSLTDWQGRTLLHHATEMGNYQMTMHLINSGADVDARDCQGRTPLMNILQCDIYFRCESILELLFDAKANIHACDNNGLSVLKQFLDAPKCHGMFLKKLSDEYSGDSEKVAKKLIDLNCSIYCALALNNSTIARMLLENGCPLVPANYHGPPENLVRHAMVRYDLENVKYLMDLDIDVNAENSNGSTIISSYGNLCYSKNEIPNILRLLLDRGGEPTRIITKGENRGRMQVCMILSWGKRASIQVLLDNNIDLKVKDEEGCTVLHYLAQNHQPNICEVLNDKEFDVNARDKDGSTPLHYINGTNMSTVQFLLDRGADVNAKDNSGLTPLLKLSQRLTNLGEFDYSLHENKLKVEKSKRIIDFLLCHGAHFHGINPDKQLSIFSNLENFRILYYRTAFASVFAELAMGEARGIPIYESIINEILGDDTLKKIFNNCKEQIGKMKQVAVCKSTSLCDILIANELEMERYVRNERLLKNLHRIRNNMEYLPYYRYVLRERVVKVTKRVRRRTAIANILCEIIGLQRDHIVADQITKYLSDLDLRKMFCK